MTQTTQLNYQIAGEGEPVVLLHGLFGSLENLGVVARELSQNYKVISIDLPDHGRSYRSDNFSYDDYAQAVKTTTEALDIEQFALLGHSMGGKVAMTLALAMPDLVSKLIIVDIAPVSYEQRHTNVINALKSVDLATLTTRKQADDTMALHVREQGVRQFLLKSLAQADGTWSWRFNLNLIESDYSELSQGISSNNQYSGQTLFIKGSESDYLLAEHQALIAELFPNSKAKIIQGAGHWLHAEKPVAFNKIVRDFLSS